MADAPFGQIKNRRIRRGWPVSVSSLNPSKRTSPDGVVRKLLLALLIDGDLCKHLVV
jgi:hypothetical protein